MNSKISTKVQQAIEEDLQHGDVTAELIPLENTLTFQLLSREKCILCGTEWFNESFIQIDPSCKIDWQASDGDKISADSIICTIIGNARSLLTAERTALNFLQTLSGTATITYSFNQLIKHTRCKLLDTRKTIPLLRQEQKYAVSCGGGVNHRIGLFDAYLIKENHIAASESITLAVQTARQMHPELLLEVEVENLVQLNEAIEAKVDRVLLDNFTTEQLKEAVEMNKDHVELEASGDITQNNIAKIAETGVNFISIGALTKHVRAIDFSLRYSE
ncbi:MAG: carboxylating nicotinate-nucleotide diphosphorylase [Gammaproteobacteria bacterium]|nr:carboxylating nicotinate-nucleotide diphosphorylase [Gammaproteobacteria bacterium]